jgi:hypothetical protein
MQMRRFRHSALKFQTTGSPAFTVSVIGTTALRLVIRTVTLGITPAIPQWHRCNNKQVAHSLESLLA